MVRPMNLVRITSSIAIAGLTSTAFAEEYGVFSGTDPDQGPYVYVEGSLHQQEDESLIGEGLGVGIGAGYGFKEWLAIEIKYDQAPKYDTELPIYVARVRVPDSEVTTSFEAVRYTSVMGVISQELMDDIWVFAKAGMSSAKGSFSVSISQDFLLGAAVSGLIPPGEVLRGESEVEDTAAVISAGLRVRLGESQQSVVMSFTQHFGDLESGSLNVAWQMHL